MVELVVIGGGSAGVRAARLAAEQGVEVVLVEASAMGGTCVNLGCVPKKLYVEASSFTHQLSEAKGFGWRSSGAFDLNWEELQSKKNAAIERLNGFYCQRLEKAGVVIKRGFARFTGPDTIEVAGESIQANRFLVATGGTPKRLAIPGAEYALTSDDVFRLEALPKSVLVVGSGYIGVEFAGIFNGLGVETDWAFRSAMPLRGFDEEIRAYLLEQVQARGINVLAEQVPQSIVKKGDVKKGDVKKGGGFEVNFGEASKTYDLVLMATGRKPNTQGLDLEKAGVECDSQGGIITDAFYRTSSPVIDALGDVRNKVALTPIAIEEAKCWVHNRVNHSDDESQWLNLVQQQVVTAVFSQPNVATIGLTQAEAEAQYDKVKVYKADFRPLKHSLTGLPDRCLFKLLVDEKTDRIIGLHIVGPEAGEMMQGFAVAIQMGATKADFDRTLAIHPTMAEELVTLV